MAVDTQKRDVIYTAIPKFLVYGNLTIGAYVENQGYAANTPWQYSYAMGDNVDYERLKESLHELLFASDEVWVFAEKVGTFPRHEDEEFGDLAVTDGVNREIRIAVKNDIPVKFYHFDAENRDITPYGAIKSRRADGDGDIVDGEWTIGTFDGDDLVLHEFEEKNVTEILDDFKIRRTDKTFGMQGEITLHNHQSPCSAAERLENHRVLRLGKDVPPRPELKSFCSVCNWPYPEEQLYQALKRGVEQHRRKA